MLCFRKDKFAYRTHQLGPYARVAEVYEDAQRSLKKYGGLLKNKTFVLRNFQNIRRGLLGATDLYQLFANNTQHSLPDFLSDALAASF